MPPPAYNRVVPQPCPEPWLRGRAESQAAAHATAWAFSLTLLSTAAVGLLALAASTSGDLQGLGLEASMAHVECYRVTRVADFVSVLFVVGSPKQELNLLLRTDTLSKTSVFLSIHSERMHRSDTMSCADFTDGDLHPYSKNCSDRAFSYRDALAAHLQPRVERFAFSSDAYENAVGDPAARIHLDGSMYLRPGFAHWLTSSHLCFAPLEAAASSTAEALRFDYGENATSEARVAADALRDFPATRGLRLASECANSTVARLFPARASHETDWLRLSGSFLRQKAYAKLEERRDVVEVGAECVAGIDALQRALSGYSVDCATMTGSADCEAGASVAFRRLSMHTLRFDVSRDGAASLQSAALPVLESLPSLVRYDEGVGQAVGRLLVLILVAYAVFVRGARNASSPRWLLSRALDRVRCRREFARAPATAKLTLTTDWERRVDFLISVAALATRVAILATRWEVFLADYVGAVLVSEAIACASSAALLLLRHWGMAYDPKIDSPLLLIAGSTSVIDSSCSVLLLFSDAPLLSASAARFSAIGRLLISLLLSIAGLTRAAFAAATCSLLASACRGPAPARLWLCVAALCWWMQSICAALAMALLFARPAAYAMVRSLPGAGGSISFCLFLGIVCVGAPSSRKTLLRVGERECKKD